ncbi:hypothetical protein [Chryseobacterium contaminans]|uniref:hypothetical protein n=1 Tax=Chryseobacterium contaminans TaxID=1423959 RepID=UPI00301B171A
MKTYKYETFTAVIEEQIRNGILQNGDKLPSIREIKERYHLRPPQYKAVSNI